MLIATGEAANWIVTESGLEPDNVSRIDVQATLWCSDDPAQVIKQCADKAAANRVGRKGRPYKVRIEGGYGDGDTAYLGSRSSDGFGRVYDKGRESGEAYYEKALRYECEYKREWASRCYYHLLGGNRGRSDTFATVATGYGSWGLELPPVVPLACALVLRRDNVEDDIDRKLAWLRVQVGPTVEWLLTAGVPYGKISEVLRM
jgi:DNA relaxase NicK